MLKASKRPYIPSAIKSSLITGFCLKKDFVFHCRKGMYVSLQMKTSLLNLLFRVPSTILV